MKRKINQIAIQRSWLETMRQLPEPRQRVGEFLLLCLEYCLDGCLPQGLTPPEGLVFTLLKPLMQKAVRDEQARLAANQKAAERMRKMRKKKRKEEHIPLKRSELHLRNASVTQGERERNASVTASVTHGATSGVQATCECLKNTGASADVAQASFQPMRAPSPPPDKECISFKQDNLQRENISKRESPLTQNPPPSKGESPDLEFAGMMTADMMASEPFLATWAEWLKYRRSIRKKVEPFGARRQLNFLARHDMDDAVAIMEQSMMMGWQGLFELDKDKQPRRSRKLVESLYTNEL